MSEIEKVDTAEKNEEQTMEYDYSKYCKPGVLLAFPWLNLEFTSEEAIKKWLDAQKKLFADIIIALQDGDRQENLREVVRTPTDEDRIQQTTLIKIYQEAVKELHTEPQFLWNNSDSRRRQALFNRVWRYYSTGLIFRENPACVHILECLPPYPSQIRKLREKLFEYKNKQIAKAEAWAQEQKITEKLTETYQTVYKELAGLEPAENYWKQLATGYKCKAFWLFFLVIITIGAGFSLLYLLMECILPRKLFLYHFTLDQIYPFGVIAPVLMGTTLYAWLLTFISRLYVSALHLARDAKEKTVMFKTYFSLLPTGEITETERAIFFNTMFTPCRTGLIRNQNLQTPVDAASRIIEQSQRKNTTPGS